MRIKYAGYIYDTEKSEIIGLYVSDEANDHPCYMSVTIYRASHGRYFLHGTGGPLTPMKGRERILPVSEEVALQLCL